MSKLTPSTVRLNDSKHALKLLFFQGGSHFIDDPAWKPDLSMNYEGTGANMQVMIYYSCGPSRMADTCLDQLIVSKVGISAGPISSRDDGNHPRWVQSVHQTLSTWLGMFFEIILIRVSFTVGLIGCRRIAINLLYKMESLMHHLLTFKRALKY